MRGLLRHRLPSLALAVIVLAVAMTASATAASLITSADIKNNTVASVDIQDGTVKTADLSPGARTAFKGVACSIPGHGSGTIQMTTREDGSIRLFCSNAFTKDNDGDGYAESDSDCDDANPVRYPGAEEIFDGLDDDCDGGLGAGSYYTGPPGTEWVGICHPGERVETLDPPDYYETEWPEQTPEVEVVGDGLDNDCDEEVDEA